MVETGEKMNKFTILKIEECNYFLKDEKNHHYTITLEFINTKQKPLVNDSIYIDEELIKSRGPYFFGTFGSPYGRKIESTDDKDIMTLETNNERIYLQRYYG
jgi:hypothetical protein